MSEARAIFLASLRAGLRGSPSAFVDEVLADYAEHFDDGARHGRHDAEIAEALGDPLALADELRAECAVSGWQSAPTPRAGVRVIAQALGRGALRISVAMFTMPLIALLILAFSIGSLAAMASGIWFLFVGSSFELNGGLLTVALGGIGLMAAGISLAALTLLGCNAFINTLARRTRAGLHHLRNSGVPR